MLETDWRINWRTIVTGIKLCTNVVPSAEFGCHFAKRKEMVDDVKTGLAKHTKIENVSRDGKRNSS